MLLNTNPEKGMELVVRTYSGYVYAICRARLTGVYPPQEIEECAAEVFAEVYRCRERLDEQKGSLKAFICTVARNRASNAYRAAIRRQPCVSLDDARLPETTDDAEDSLLAAETTDELISAIRSLGQPDSEIFIRKYYFGQSTREIAKALELKENTVDKRVSRGCAKLRSLMKGVLYDE